WWKHLQAQDYDVGSCQLRRRQTICEQGSVHVGALLRPGCAFEADRHGVADRRCLPCCHRQFHPLDVVRGTRTSEDAGTCCTSQAAHLTTGEQSGVAMTTAANGRDNATWAAAIDYIGRVAVSRTHDRAAGLRGAGDEAGEGHYIINLHASGRLRFALHMQ